MPVHHSQGAPDGETVPAALEVKRLCKVYGGTVALADVDMTVSPGEIHGLLGENGAGKSTLVKLLAGLEPRDGGELLVFGVECPASRPEFMAELGCAFIHQTVPLVEGMTIAENIALVTGFPRRWGVIDAATMRASARQSLARLGMSELDVDTMVGELPLATRAVVAIARALARDARLIVLDEPTASLQAHEVRVLFDILRRLRAAGVALILISHRIDEVLSICDRVTVLRNGSVVASDSTTTMTEDTLIELILGQPLADVVAVDRGRTGSRRQAILHLEAAQGLGVGPLTLDVVAGEVVGLTGLADAGFGVVGEMIFGMGALVTGSMELDGRPYAPSGPAEAIACGVAYVPADRAGSAVAIGLRLYENIFLNPRRGSLKPARDRSEIRASRGILERFDVRPPDPELEVLTLSGGNQQKLVLGKWLSERPRLIILHEPTAAVDVGARTELYRRLRGDAQARGTAALVLTSDFEEVVEVCDRAYVLVEGHIHAELAGDELTVPGVTQAAYGGTSPEAEMRRPT